MVFSSLTFVYAFLPLVAALYYACPSRRWRNAVLLAVSVLFYAWGEPRYVFLMLAAALAAWVGGLCMERLRGRPGPRRAAFWTTTGLLVGNLLVFKYLNLFVHSAQALLGGSWVWRDIALPIGISFYTFQILSYVIDLYRGKIPVQRNFFRLALYVTFFPQMIAGPIVRYETVQDEILGRRENWEEVTAGLRRFIVGLAKKTLLANSVAVVCETVYAGDPATFGTLFYWIAAMAYALQIYFDFSGYSDMAIGMGLLFGFHFLENFDYPYTAVSVTDFWRRWHISLSTWFRDYVYIPLGGNRVSRAKWVRNILVVWALTGFWHGAQWNFVLWGLYYAALLLLEKLFLHRALDRLPKGVGWAYTAVCVLVGWVLFDRTDLSQMAAALGMMFRPQATDFLGVVAANADLPARLLTLPIGAVCMLPLGKRLRERLPEGGAGMALVRAAVYGALLLLCLMVTLSSSYNPFIYFRF